MRAILILATWLACAFMAHGQSPGSGPTDGAQDARQLVVLPEPMRTHTLANMRDHLLALQQIHERLSAGDFVAASDIAEKRLGLSSLESHGAAHIAARLPPPMQEVGTRMHRAASRFAVEAQSAAATGDVRPLLSSLGAVVQQCVACHAAYRYQ